MKKALFVILLVVLTVLPLAANSTLVNVGYNVQTNYWGVEDLNVRSLSINFTHLNGDTSGFYIQANPYFGLSFKGPGGVAKFSDYNETLLGANLLVGFGSDLNFGDFGLLIGGGGFMDINAYEFGLGTAFQFVGGAGLGANAYFQTGSNLAINAGMTLGWHPWGTVFGDATGDLSDFGMFTFNFNVGIGFRTGGTSSSYDTDW